MRCRLCEAIVRHLAFKNHR